MRLAPIAIIFLFCAAVLSEPDLSHPPLRVEPPPSKRKKARGPAFYVDANNGDDSAKGSKRMPWKTVQNALERLSSGDTLYLREGVYYENVYIDLSGREGKPVTVRGYPGERAIIDGGIREFFESPSSAWEPFDDGGKSEYRSAKP